MTTKSFFWIATTLVLASAPVMGSPWIYMNNTTGLEVFSRPTEAGDDLSGVGTAVPFFAQPFTVSLSGNYNLAASASEPESFDTFIHLYAGSFNLAAPLNNFLAANDDAVNGSPHLGSALFGQPLVAGNVYVLVIDGFGNTDAGEFSASISGPGDVSPVPEPSTFALAGLGFAGLWLEQRRRAFNR